MKKTPASFFLLGFCLLLLAACASTKPRFSGPVTYVLPMEKLTWAVDSKLHRDGTNILCGQQLLTAAMANRPDLQKAFRGKQLLITNNIDYAVVLMINPKNTNTLWLEDATWTPYVDNFHFRSNPPSPVFFTIPLP